MVQHPQMTPQEREVLEMALRDQGMEVLKTGSGREALEQIAWSRNRGLPVFAETCPQYLTLTQEILETHGALAKIGPPIRSAQDRAALWSALADGTLQVVASDHAPKSKDPKGDFLAQGFWGGIGGAEAKGIGDEAGNEICGNGRGDGKTPERQATGQNGGGGDSLRVDQHVVSAVPKHASE
jgi:CheY-like chemotaxis protein